MLCDRFFYGIVCKTKQNSKRYLTSKTQTDMKKYIGAILQLIGVLILAIPYFTNNSTNVTLLLGVLVVILGFALHIILGRRSKL